MTKEEKQKERKEKREAYKFSKSRSLFRDGFNKYHAICFVFAYLKLFYFYTYLDIFNKPEIIYDYDFIYAFLFLLILLFIHYRSYKYDYFEYKNGKFKISFIPIFFIVFFDFIFAMLLVVTIRLPFELYLIDNPLNNIIIQKEVNADCEIKEGTGSRRSINISEGIYYNFDFNGSEETIKASYNIKRIEEIEKNNYKQKLRIYLKKGHFDTYILQRYELLD